MTFYNYVELTNAVAVGARTLAINRAAYAGPPTACSLEQTALKNAAGNLTTSNITIAAETFTGSFYVFRLTTGHRRDRVGHLSVQFDDPILQYQPLSRDWRYRGLSDRVLH